MRALTPCGGAAAGVADASLPRLYAVTPDPSAFSDLQVFMDGIVRVLRRGTGLIQFRARSLETDPDAYLAALRHVRAISLAHGAHLIANPPSGVFTQAARIADGVHLGSAALMRCTARPVPEAAMLSAACHDAAQLQRAQALNVDFVTLSPVLATATHPDATPLGWAGFAALAAESRLPIYALGGMDPAMLAVARAHGAHGIAAIRGLWLA